MEVEMEISESRNLKAKLEMRERERQGRRQGGHPVLFPGAHSPGRPMGPIGREIVFLVLKKKLKTFGPGR